MPVIRSHVRLRLSRLTLSLYSSLIVTLGSSVIGARTGPCRRCGSSLKTYPPNCGAIGSGCACASSTARHMVTRPMQVATARAITRTRISHVADTREGLFRRARVQSLDRLVVVRQRRRLLNHVHGAELFHIFDLLRRRVS